MRGLTDDFEEHCGWPRTTSQEAAMRLSPSAVPPVVSALVCLVLAAGPDARAQSPTGAAGSGSAGSGPNRAPVVRDGQLLREILGAAGGKDVAKTLSHTCISAAPGDQVHPRVAYTPTARNYLVVFEDHQYGLDYDIGAVWTGADGAPTMFLNVTSEWNNAQKAPSVACNRATGDFLVVWEDVYSDTDHDIYGRMLSGRGGALAPTFVINSDVGYESAPAVAYDVYSNTFLVVYERFTGDPEFPVKDVWANVVTADGVVQAPQVVAGTTDDERAPDVACAPPSHKYLVAYEKHPTTGADCDVWGQFVATDGSALGPALRITDQPECDSAPRVTYNPYESEFALVWVSGSATNPDLGMRDMDATTGEMHHYAALQTLGADFKPAIAFFPGGDLFAIPWEWEYSDTDHDLYCLWDDDDYLGGEFISPISAWPFWEAAPAVATDEYLSGLVTWEDTRNAAESQTDIWADVLRLGVVSGRVFAGLPSDEGAPLPGVQVTLYGSHSAGVTGDQVDVDYTGYDGSYRLRFIGLYEYYTIVETNLPGYSDGAATSPGGVVLDANRIQLVGPALAVDHQDNKFWDVSGVSVGPAGPTGGPLWVSAPWPNPSRAGVSLALRGGVGGTITLEVLDVTGRSVFRSVRPRPAVDKIVWDGRLEGGRAAPPGVYHLRLSDGVSEVVRRAVVMR
jgi:hypothetical protein